MNMRDFFDGRIPPFLVAMEAARQDLFGEMTYVYMEGR
jgi:hypothetical protein